MVLFKIFITILYIILFFGTISAFVYMSDLLKKYNKILYTISIISLLFAILSLMLIGFYIIWE